MNATPQLKSEEGYILRSVNRRLISAMLDAHQEDPPGTFAALPWLDEAEEVSPQFADFLFELEVHSSTGRIHFWSIHSSDDAFLGLVGLGDELQTEMSQWNLGYWVRESARRRGIARTAVNTVFTWLASLPQNVVVEITVHPQNHAGLATCRSICTIWGGQRTAPDFWPIDVRGRTVPHAVWLVELGGEVSV